MVKISELMIYDMRYSTRLRHTDIQHFSVIRDITRVCVILGLAIFVELRLVTDRQTDGQTMTAYTALA